MKLANYLLLLVLTVALAACSGGHGFEGEYETSMGSSNEFLGAFAASQGVQRIVIGADYIESQGERTGFEDIFVRESAGERYLVFRDGKAEEAWKIVDQDTLMQGDGLMNVRLVRVRQ